MSSRPCSRRAWLSLSLLALGASALVGACAGDDSEAPPPNVDTFTPPGIQTGPCENEGATRDCSVDLGTTDSGVHSCLVGVQSCVDGAWSGCGAGEVRELASGAPGACPANPCDPACEEYTESPASPITDPGGAATPSTAFGLPSDLPAGFAANGLPSPCNPAADACQFDHKCDPVTNECRPWNDGEFDPAAMLPDVTMKIPCDNGEVQICNRGGVATQATVNFSTYDDGTPGGTFGLCGAGSIIASQEDVDGDWDAANAVYTGAINPGECVPCDTCTAEMDGPGNLKDLVANHQDNADEPWFPESNCLNNWSGYDKNGVTCSCANITTSVSGSPANMYIMLDNSGSMNFDTPTRWSIATAGLTNFFSDNATSPGLGVAFRLWPDGPASTVGCFGTTGLFQPAVCDNTACQIPDIAHDYLTVDAAPTDTHEAALLGNMPASADGTLWDGTPMNPALQGGVDWAINFEATNPGESAVVVLITDGDPFQCDTSIPNIQAIAAAGAAAGVETYTIALNGGNVTDLTNIANSGNGIFFDLTSGNALQFTQTMAVIQASVSPCSFTVNGIDPGNTTITFNPSVGPSVPLVEVANLAGCTGASDEFYYDIPAAPTQITFCPVTCSTVNGDLGSSVDIVGGCTGGFAAYDFYDTYEALCTPPLGPEWTFLAYDTDTPMASWIDFEVRTSATSGGLASEAFVPVATASAGSEDVGVYAMPFVNPIDLQASLSGSQARANWLELHASLNPDPGGSVTSSLNEWQVSYTCVPQE